MVRPERGVSRPCALAALLVLLMPANASARTEAKQHAPGLWGQDELQRSIRLLENDSDLLSRAFADTAPGLEVDEPRRAELAAAVAALESDLDELRDGYGLRSHGSRHPLLADVQEVIARGGPLTDELLSLQPSPALRVAAEQVAIDLRHLLSELRREREGYRGYRGWTTRRSYGDHVKIAVAEVEDLSDDLKRFFLRTDPARPEVERWVVRPGGERHLVHQARMEQAVLEFEEAADVLKRAYHRRDGPGDVTDLVDTLVRTARIIDYSMADASTDDEARREWNEIRPPLRLLIRAHGLRGIGTGWETAP